MILSKILPVSLVLLTLTLLISIPASSAVSNASLNQTDDENNVKVPNYEITKVSMPVQTAWIEPGTYISPNITIINAGSDDTSSQLVQLQAFLGKYQLISKNNTFSVFKAGEERTVTPDYLVPNGVPTGEYTLTVSINRGKEEGGEDTENNKASAPDQLNVKQITSKAKVRSCNCA